MLKLFKMKNKTLISYKEIIIILLLSIYVVIAYYNPLPFNGYKLMVSFIILAFCIFILYKERSKINFKTRLINFLIMLSIFGLVFFSYIKIFQEKRIEEIISKVKNR